MKLKMDELDLVQLYWHDYGKKNYVDAMKCLSEDETVRNIGVTNMDVRRPGGVQDCWRPAGPEPSAGTHCWTGGLSTG